MTHLGDLLSAWLDGELPPPERRAAAEHLAACAECRLELSITEAGRAAVRSLPVLAAPELVGGARRRRAPAAAWAAAVAAGLAVVLWIGPGQPDPAFEMDLLEGQHVARVVGDPGISTFRGEQP